MQRIQRTSNNKHERRWARIQLDLLARVPLTVQIMELEPDFRIIALGGEVCVEVGNLINAEFGGENIIVAYANDVVSYIPSSLIVKEDMEYHGYEGEISNVYYNLPSRYSEQIDEELQRGIRKLLDKIKRENVFKGNINELRNSWPFFR